MSLTKKIAEDLIKAIKSKDELCVNCLRILKSTLKNKQVEKGRELKDEEILSVVSSLIRKGTEASKEFRKGGRSDMADKEDLEVKILYRYLPEQLNDSEIEKILKETIDELSAKGLNDLGRVMKTAMARMAGKAQGKEVNRIARKLLS